MQTTDKAGDGPRSSEGLGPLLEDAAYDCMSELAGVDTHDVNLRDHPEAWAAIEAFAAKVRAAERERWRAAALHGHIYEGSCPDETQPDARDDKCPLCVLLGPNVRGEAATTAARKEASNEH